MLEYIKIYGKINIRSDFMEILQLKYFVSTARYQSIAKTAKEFMVPASSVSVAIKKLEEELEVSLFDRSANRIKLNKNGEIFFKSISLCEKELKNVKAELLNRSKIQKGEIKLLILTNRSSVTDAIVEFKNEYPDTSFTISHDSFAKPESYDLVICDSEIDSESFEKKELIREEIFLGVHKSNPLSKYNSVKLTTLSEEKFISMNKGSRIREFTDSLLENGGISPVHAIECSDPYYICKYLKMGLGVTFFPSVSWKREIDDSIKLLKINDGVFRTSYLYTNKACSDIAKIFSHNLELSVKKSFNFSV